MLLSQIDYLEILFLRKIKDYILEKWKLGFQKLANIEMKLCSQIVIQINAIK